jgi:hypothetical protein
VEDALEYARRRASAAIAVVNLVLLVAHGWVHRVLGVALSPAQTAIVYGLIVPGPLIALLLLVRSPFLANCVLLITMTVGLVFGGLFHYLVVSPDHVAHLPPSSGGALFRASAAGLAIAEAIGIMVAIAGLRRSAGVRDEIPNHQVNIREEP